MPKNHTVAQGDCISSIAEKNGLFWETVWNHPENSELKEKRKDPNILLPGDVVFVPDKQMKEESGATEQCHKFRKKGVPAKIRLQILDDDDEPRADEPYILEIDGKAISGQTDSEGVIEQFIPPNARKGKLLVGEEQEEYLLDLGHIDPIDTVAGVQVRLQNLGYDCGGADGKLGSKTRAAILEFQQKHELEEIEETGEIDQATLDKLEEIHGC
jgi:hypothetical protein